MRDQDTAPATRSTALADDPLAANAVAHRYRVGTTRLLRDRMPFGMGNFLALIGIAYGVEWLYYPARWRPLVLSYAGCLLVSLVGIRALRQAFTRTLPVSVSITIAYLVCLGLYFGMTHNSAELCVFALNGVLTGTAVLLPWGVTGQVTVWAGAFVAYGAALLLGAQPMWPLPYGVFALFAHGGLTSVGAHFLERYRFSAYRHAAESERHAAASASANTAKSEFLATMSHELRTPLSIIVGYTDLLLEGMFREPAALRNTLTRIADQSRQLLDLIDGMLDLNRLESGTIEVVAGEFTVPELFERLRANLPASWYKPHVRVDWQIGEPPLVMRSDRSKVELILRNLVHNALKFTDQGVVTVSTQPHPASGRMRFSVSDTGPGIVPEERARIFEMFSQGSHAPAGGGVGLGLYIVKRFTEALGGEISVESLPGAGARFTVSLPLEARGARRATVETA